MPRTKLQEREYIPIQIKQHVLETSGYCCGHCGKKIPTLEDDFTLDHAIPLNKGGTNEEENLVALCEACNKAKSDNIVDPQIYYHCLPKKRKNELDKLFDQYIEQIDWLTNDDLFQLDQFEMKLMAPKQNKASRRLIYIPVKATIHRMTTNDAFAYIQDYRRILTAKDQGLLATNPKDLSSCYRIKIGKQEIAVLQTYIIRGNWGPPEHTLKLPQVRICLFVDKKMQEKYENTACALCAILEGTLYEIKKTFKKTGENAMFPVRILGITSDKTAVQTLNILYQAYPHQYNTEILHFNTSPKGGTAFSLSTIIWNGNKKELIQYLDGKKQEELSDNLIDLMNPILDRIYARQES